LGALIWGALTISLISISTAPLLLLTGWFVGQTIETGIAGLVVGVGLGAEKLRSLTLWVIAFVIVAFVLGVVLQNI
jgi:hypothetical protein